jgi:hypothetical protein
MDFLTEPLQRWEAFSVLLGMFVLLWRPWKK